MAFKNQIYVVNYEKHCDTIILDIIGTDKHGQQITGQVRVRKMDLKEFQEFSQSLNIVPCNESYGISVVNYNTYYSIDVDHHKSIDDHPWFSLDKVAIDDAYNSNKYGKFYFGLPPVVYLHMIGQVCGEI